MLADIDWSRSWYGSIANAAEKIIDQPGLLTALNQQSESMRLTNHRGLPLCFVEHFTLPEGAAYEAFISNTGKVPTRDNLHDFFNALVWLSFPTIKRQLNALQAAQIECTGIGRTRGAARDAATVFDENAALLVVSDTAQGRSVLEALRNHQWHSAFVEQSAAFSAHAQVWLFGHALMEKLVRPYKAITAHAWVVNAPERFFAMPHEQRRGWLDTQVAEALSVVQSLQTSSFTPLPLLGIPGWWHAQDRDFYNDESVFRTKRK